MLSEKCLKMQKNLSWAKFRLAKLPIFSLVKHQVLNKFRSRFRNNTIVLTVPLSGCGAGGGNVREQSDQHLAVPHPRQVQASRRGGDGVLWHRSAQRLASR
jgi:hypothetical protein